MASTLRTILDRRGANVSGSIDSTSGSGSNNRDDDDGSIPDRLVSMSFEGRKGVFADNF